jgi:hypothetical protein
MKTLQSTQNTPQYLTPSEIENPQIVIEEFHDFYELNSVRASLLELLQIALTSDGPAYDTGQKRSDLLHLNQQLIRLVEATNLLSSE